MDRQLTAFFKYFQSLSSSVVPLSGFEKLCALTFGTCHLLSWIYTLLQSPQEDVMYRFMERWAWVLGILFPLLSRIKPSIIHINWRSQGMLKRKIIRSSPGSIATRTQLHSCLRTPWIAVSIVLTLKVRFVTSGVIVSSLNLFGCWLLQFIIAYMRRLLLCVQNLHCYPSYQALRYSREHHCWDFSLQQWDSWSPVLENY